MSNNVDNAQVRVQAHFLKNYNVYNFGRFVQLNKLRSDKMIFLKLGHFPKTYNKWTLVNESDQN